jgi:ubiquinone/menaquinone biosynthesis C-methylase UbiE
LAEWVFYITEEISVKDFEAQGYVLDVGGGGEGVIGQLKGAQVIAIDPNRRELEEAAPGPLKIVMDARELQFLDCAFGAATAFFALMYIKSKDHEKVFDEVFRVLAPGGTFRVWDAILTPRPDDANQDVVSVRLLIKLPNTEISTGYGTRWPEQTQDIDYYAQLAESAGFSVSAREQNDHVLYLELQKP